MPFSAIVQPNKYMAGYSAVPLRIFDTDYDVSEDYKYIVNICYDEITTSAEVGYVIGTNVFTRITTLTPHKFSVGDTVLLDDKLNNNLYTNYYTVVSIISTLEFVIDLVEGRPFGAQPMRVSKVIKYKMNPDLQGSAKLDLSNVLKDFVTENLTGQSQSYGLTYDGPNTKFDYSLKCGSESKYRFEFTNHINRSGSLGFFNSSITNLANVPFKVGDIINVVQNTYGWAYIDNTYTGTLIGFTGSTNVPFKVGQQITVVGQVTNPSYNGPTTVTAIPSARVLQTDKLYLLNTPAEPGVIYGNPAPEYNGVATITEISIVSGFGCVIKTNKPFTSFGLPFIPGYIEYADDRKTVQPNILNITGLSVYNAHLNNNEYSLTFFDKYVAQNRSANLNNISTILNNTNKYRVEKNTIGFLLGHKATNQVSSGGLYTFFNQNNTQLGQIFVVNTTDDYYLPLGLEQISKSNWNYLGFNIILRFGTVFSFHNGTVARGIYNGKPWFQIQRSTAAGGSSGPDNIIWNTGGYWQIMQGTFPGTLERARLYPSNLNSNQPPASVNYSSTYNPSQKNWWQSPYFSDIESEQVLNFPGYSGNVDNYTISIADGTGATTNTLSFEFNDDCSMYEVYHLMWKDKLGSYISYPFIYMSRDNIEVDRRSFYKQNQNWDNNSFGYYDYDRGEKDFFVRSRKSIILNSGWLYEFERDLMEDLIQSPSVYLQTPDNRLYAGKLEETNIEIYKERNDDIFSYSFNFIFSNNEYRF